MLSSQLFHRVFGVYAGLTVASSLIFAVILSAASERRLQSIAFAIAV